MPLPGESNQKERTSTPAGASATAPAATTATTARGFAATPMSRRAFVATSGALAGIAAASAATGASLFSQGTPEAYASEGASDDKIVWSQCNINCGGNCIFQWHVRDGKIAFMETDTIGNPDFQARACLRGRAMRRWINSPDRLMYPMRRVGKRGEGKFERITWEEAINIIADQLKYTIEIYGNEAIFINYATGMYSTTGKPANRLLGILGGYLNQVYDYSTNMLQAALPYMYGKDCSPYDNIFASSFSEAGEHSDLIVMFGNSPAETRMGGLNATWDFTQARERVLARGGRVIHIDYRMNETCSAHGDEWVPIRPGADAALVSAIAHEWIVNGQVDEEFLHTYCVGYDEQTMPESARGQHKSYYDYIMGQGYDMMEKTPEWAAPITQIPAARIRSLAESIAAADAPYICQGWGPQRHTNGEDATRAICMLPVLIGKIGLPGTNTGQREAEPPTYLVGKLPSKNPVKTGLPVYEWLDAVDHGDQMTATNAGIKGADGLSTGIKFLWNYAGNCLTNQHGDINYTHDILVDESKCEFILVWDTVLTDTAKYADLLLPDAMRGEQLNMQTQGYAEYYTGVVVGGPAQDAPGECRTSYDVCADIADRFGAREEFTQGRTQEEWIRYLYEKGAEKDPDMPTWEQINEQGVYKRPLPPCIGMEEFRRDPAGHPLQTPSGKIEIYSEQLDALNDAWELPDGEEIHPIPLYSPGFQGPGSTTDDFPLYCAGFHHKSRAHSSYGALGVLEQCARQQMWINPLDAKPRGIANGDMCLVASPVGEVVIEALVTQRIIPGTVGIPQGAWHDADMDGDRIDYGGCVNTLTAYRPTPLGKGNGPAHSMIVRVDKTTKTARTPLTKPSNITDPAACMAPVQ